MSDAGSSDVDGKSWADIRRAAYAAAVETREHLYETALNFYGEPAWERRAFAVHLLGIAAAYDPRALAALRETCACDAAWQVHEALAMAFDAYCAATGYERAVPVIEAWLASSQPEVRRAVSEGLRPWTAVARPYFQTHPERAVELLGRLRDDPDPKVQKSVGNALRDIWRRQPDLVVDAVRTWRANGASSPSRCAIARLALKDAVAADPELAALYSE